MEQRLAYLHNNPLETGIVNEPAHYLYGSARDYAATEAALNFVVVAYNIMSLFKQAVLQSDTPHQLKTLRYKIFAIGGYITRSGNQKIRNLSLAMKRRKWIKGIWDESQNFSWPFAPT